MVKEDDAVLVVHVVHVVHPLTHHVLGTQVVNVA
jgi:hypothetical protein